MPVELFKSARILVLARFMERHLASLENTGKHLIYSGELSNFPPGMCQTNAGGVLVILNCNLMLACLLLIL
jgi:hypothetical protein